MDTAFNWPQEDFGQVDLGDTRLVNRFLKILSHIISNNHGFITQSFKQWKDAKATYRWLKNKNVTTEPILEASAKSCFNNDHDIIVVPLDASSLNIKDTNKKKNLGHIGNSKSKQTGYQVISALAYSSEGEALGLLDQIYWKRKKNKKSKESSQAQKRRQRAFEEKETSYIVKIANHCEELKDKYSPNKKLWFQHDRGGDSQDLLREAAKSENYYTIRIGQDRKFKGNTVTRLSKAFRLQKPRLGGLLHLPRCGNHTKSKVYVEIYSDRFSIELKKYKDKNVDFANLHIIEVRGEPGSNIHWKLATNYPVETLQDIILVIKNYTLRWKVENFHRVWKNTCQVEKTQLRQEKRIQIWCILNAMVSMRIERLKDLARKEETVLASEEFSEEEIQAILLLRKPKHDKNNPITLKQAVYWVAELGGYRGPKSSGGPPGAVVIGRGLEYITPAAHLLKDFTLVPKTYG